MGKIALITGAGRNIGKSIALALAQEGFDIVINVRKSLDEGEAVARLVRGLGRQAQVCAANVANPADVKQMFSTIQQSFGHLNALVNNAAIRGESEFNALSFDEWKRVLDICLDGAFLCSQASLPLLSGQEDASIVNIGGLTAHAGATHRAHVVTAKAGLVGFTRALAEELAPAGIRVNCVSPGLVDTVRVADSAPVAPAHHKKKSNFMGRRGTAEEIADVVSWLCSTRSSYVTGQVVHANGGAYLGG